MKRFRSNLGWVYIVVAAVIISSLSYLGYKKTHPATPEYAGIFVVSTPLEFGDTTIRGVLRKDSPAGQSGNYIVVLSDGRPATLDIKELDVLLDKTVTVTGYLEPSVDGSIPMTMKVSSIEESL